ncbi:hypothetical protein BH23GEM11_BH23GEM11_06720 [soil metagenome]
MTIARLTNAILRRAGLEVHRISSPDPKPPVPRLFDHPLEAFYFQTGRGGTLAAFRCPIEKIVKDNGFRYPPYGYEPSALTMIEYLRDGCREYSGSYIERHQQWRAANVRNAADNLIGVRAAPRLEELSKHVAVFPWDTVDADLRQQQIERTMKAEYRRHGRPNLDVEAMVPEKGIMQFDRCVKVLHALRTEGYQRAHGDIHVTLLRRGGDWRFLLSGAGKHRTIAMAALEEVYVPAQFHGIPRIVEPGDVEYWPQVRRGVWPRASAVDYFHHLFDFDSMAWAGEQALV